MPCHLACGTTLTATYLREDKPCLSVRTTQTPTPCACSRWLGWAHCSARRWWRPGAAEAAGVTPLQRLRRSPARHPHRHPPAPHPSPARAPRHLRLPRPQALHRHPHRPLHPHPHRPLYRPPPVWHLPRWWYRPRRHRAHHHRQLLPRPHRSLVRHQHQRLRRCPAGAQACCWAASTPLRPSEP